MKEEIKRIKSVKRREFFLNLGKGIAAILLLNSVPVRIFAKKNNAAKLPDKKIKVQIHPLAVKRNSKG